MGNAFLLYLQKHAIIGFITPITAALIAALKVFNEIGQSICIALGILTALLTAYVKYLEAKKLRNKKN